MVKNYYDKICTLSIIESFKELYPKNKIIQEIHPETGKKLYKTFSPFYNNNSKHPELYFNENHDIAPSFLCWGTGMKGCIVQLLDNYLGKEKAIKSLLKKLNLNLNSLEKNVFEKDFEELGDDMSEQDFYILSNSILSNNSSRLVDGSWINTDTGKWQGWDKPLFE